MHISPEWYTFKLIGKFRNTEVSRKYRKIPFQSEFQETDTLGGRQSKDDINSSPFIFLTNMTFNSTSYVFSHKNLTQI